MTEPCEHPVQTNSGHCALCRRYMVTDCYALNAEPDGCHVVVGMARNATQDVLVCNRLLPCPLHPF
jgi:hypothetical protein